jgi:hypothetical protein
MKMKNRSRLGKGHVVHTATPPQASICIARALSERQKFIIVSKSLENSKKKTSEMSIVRSLITNIDSKTLAYIVVVAKYKFERLRVLGGYLLTR